MKTVKLMILTFLVGMTGIASADGMPLPWPFPWAEECPVNWQGMVGRYTLSHSENAQIDLSISVVKHAGTKVVRVAWISKEGELLAEGFDFLELGQRNLRMYLFPMDKKEPAVIAEIKMYYQSHSRSCAKRNLVPIMSVERPGAANAPETSYELMKQND